MRTLCFGEAIVDLVCRRPARSLAEADTFVAHPGGVVANVAATAARAGAAVSLAGGAGDDPWGAWLHDRLAAEQVDLRWFGLAGGLRTALAFVTLDEHGEPDYQLYGDGIATVISALDDRLPEAVDACDALLFTSNTLAGKQEAAPRSPPASARSSWAARSSSTPTCASLAGTTAPAGREPPPGSACRARSS